MDFYKTKKFWIVFILGFLVGIFVFLPITAFKTKLLNIIAGKTGLNIQIADLSIGTGLIYKGRNVIAIKGTDATLPIGRKGEIQCQKLAISPSILALVMLKVQSTLFCGVSDDSSITVELKSGTLFNFKKIDLNLYPEKFSLKSLQLGGLEGELDGEASVEALDPKTKQMASLDLKLTAHRFKTPGFNTPFFRLPEIDFDKFEASAELSNNELSLKKLKFGTASSSIQGSIGGNISLSSNNMPTGGKIVGELRTNPLFEKSHLRDIGMNSAFGPVNEATGKRNFTKAVKKGFQWILDPPVDNKS